MFNRKLLAKSFPLLRSNSVHKIKVIRSSALFAMLSFCFLPSSQPVLAQQNEGKLDAVPAELNLENLFGEPTGDAVRWLGTFLTRNPDWALSITDHTVTLHSFRTKIKDSIEIPRLATMVESIKGEVREGQCDIKIDPQPNTWKLSWDASKVMSQDDFELVITMVCNERPVTIEQAGMITAQADNMVRLPAHRAITTGKAIRYEPQSFKNTVGWWSNVGDSASWSFDVRQPGRYSVAVLYGCGAGQGGSAMKLSLSSQPASGQGSSAGNISFKVNETGHFQNFQWTTIGEVEFPAEGTYRLQVESEKIAKNAAMDIRQIDLICQAQ